MTKENSFADIGNISNFHSNSIFLDYQGSKADIHNQSMREESFTKSNEQKKKTKKTTPKNLVQNHFAWM